jgi:hypothetical protein
MGELRLGRSVTWSFCRWTYRQGTGVYVVVPSAKNEVEFFAEVFDNLSLKIEFQKSKIFINTVNIVDFQPFLSVLPKRQLKQ